jgi:hypothetical protein
MKVKSYITGQRWLEERPLAADGAAPPAEERSDPASDEIARVLSDVVRSTNLVVLTGLGTSLCIKEGDNPKAPTMAALWTAVHRVYAQPVQGRASWDEILAIARQPAGNENIEELLSRSKTAESFVSSMMPKRLSGKRSISWSLTKNCPSTSHSSGVLRVDP